MPSDSDDRAVVPERVPYAEQVVLVDHDPQWAVAFAADRRDIESVLGGAALVVDQVGSLATRRWRYIQDYADAKSEAVEQILGRVAQGRR